MGAAVHPLLAEAARPCRHAVGDRWFVDETYVRVAGRRRYVYRAVDQFGQVIDVLVAARRDADAARWFLERALGATKVTPVEVTTDQAPVDPAVLEELLPAAWHHTDRDANNRVECDHGRLKARLRPMRGLKQHRSAGVIIMGTHWSRTFAADTTSWRSRSQRAGGWPSPSTSWPGDLIWGGVRGFSMPWVGATQQRPRRHPQPHTSVALCPPGARRSCSKAPLSVSVS